MSKKRKTEDWRYRQSRRQDLVHIFIFLLLLVVFHVLLVQVSRTKREDIITDVRRGWIGLDLNLEI